MQVSCDLVRPTCGACERYRRNRPEHRCSYGAHTVTSAPRLPGMPAVDADVFLPRTRSGLRTLKGVPKAPVPAGSEAEMASERAEQAPTGRTLEAPTEHLTTRMAAANLSGRRLSFCPRSLYRL